MENIIETKNLSKAYFGVPALNSVNISIRKGEVHALVGENGAGKSTLIKMISGVLDPTEGKIFFEDEEVIFKSAQQARQKGIVTIFQELTLVPYLTVAENIFLGSLPLRSGFVDKKVLIKRTKEILERLEINLGVHDFVGSLSAGKKQLVEIARALAHHAQVVVFDEPTASLSESEVEGLFKLIETLKSHGTAIIYITHKMNEVFRLADRITVLRDGNLINTLNKNETNEAKIVGMMIGREISNYYEKIDKSINGEVLRIENFSLKGEFEDVSFSLRKGEILGLYGLVGAGRSEIIKSLYGIDKRDSGTIYLKGEKINIKHPRDAVKNKIALVPEERKEEGLVLNMDINKNLSLVKVRELTKSIFLSKGKQRKLYNDYKKALSIRSVSDSQRVKYLSGGNQQKVVLGKWLSINPEILILDEPTRGIDVGSKAQIHKLIAQLASDGMAVIVISSEMPEIIGVSDRVLTLYDGKLTGEFVGDEITETNLINAITPY